MLHDYGTPTGGAELQVLALRDGLRRAGHDVRLLSSRASLVPGPQQADATCFGTTRGRLQVVSQTANPSAVRSVRRELDRFRPDVVHVRMFLAQLSPLVLPLLRDHPAVYQAVWYKAICPAGTKLLPDGSTCQVRAGAVCVRNGCTTPQSWVLHMAQMAMVRRWRDVFDVVTALGGTIAGRLRAEGFGDVEVVPNGVRVGGAPPPLSDPPLVVFAGRLVHPKGVDVLVRAMAQVRRSVPSARTVIAGHGPERARLGELVAQLGLEATVELTGHLTRAEVEERFRGAWVQAVPGRWEEPFGNVVTEAMARGTAVVASALGGPAEIVRDGTTGVLVPPGDVSALAAALTNLLTDRRKAEAMGHAGRALVESAYGEDRVVSAYEDVYRRAVARHRAKRDATSR